MWHLKPNSCKIATFLLLSGSVLLLYYQEDIEVNLQNGELVENYLSSTENSLKNHQNVENHSEIKKILSNVTSGQEFSGEKIRSFNGAKKFENVEKWIGKKPQPSKWNCEKWGVVTTIFPPSESVRRFLYRKDWCVVVVGDKDKPKVIYVPTFKKALHSVQF